MKKLILGMATGSKRVAPRAEHLCQRVFAGLQFFFCPAVKSSDVLSFFSIYCLHLLDIASIRALRLPIRDQRHCYHVLEGAAIIAQRLLEARQH